MDTRQEQNLLNKIMLRIEAAKERRARHRLALVIMALLATGSASIPLWHNFWFDITQSGFSQYLALLFSDGHAIIINWQDFTLGLLESLPTVSTAAMLATLLIFLLTFKFFIQLGHYEHTNILPI